jgi:hypothetical protein
MAKARLTRLAQRLATLEAHVGDGGNACGPHLIIDYTRSWRTDGTAATDALVNEDRRRFTRAIEQVRTEARAQKCDEPYWVLSVRVADDGSVDVAGCPWWPETPRRPEHRVFAAGREGVWRRYA